MRKANSNCSFRSKNHVGIRGRTLVCFHVTSNILNFTIDLEVYRGRPRRKAMQSPPDIDGHRAGGDDVGALHQDALTPLLQPAWPAVVLIITKCAWPSHHQPFPVKDVSAPVAASAGQVPADPVTASAGQAPADPVTAAAGQVPADPVTDSAGPH